MIIRGGSAGGSGPEDPMIERIEKLEGKMDKVEGKLSSIEVSLAEIKGQLSQMPKASDLVRLSEAVGKIDGRISQLPTKSNVFVYVVGAVISITLLIFGIARFFDA
jgi:hypothetical protein